MSKKTASVGKKEQRLAFITELINREGYVTVDALAETLSLSRMTVHRDLDELQSASVLRKVRGGASAFRSAQFESGHAFRARLALDEKRQIAKAAAALASPGDVIIVDASTSAMAVVPHLMEILPLTIITNYWTLLEELRGKPDINLIGLGGNYVHQYNAFLGVVCEQALSELYADVLFASVSALTDLTLYHQDQRIVSVKRAMMQASKRRVLLLDNSKIGHGSLHRLGSVTEFTHVVVDHDVQDAVIEKIRDAGVDVIVASEDSPQPN